MVIALLFEEAITMDDVRRAWEAWERYGEGRRPPLWRVLAEQPGIDVEAVRAAAAHAYGFARADISPYATLAFLEMYAHQFSGTQWERMIELCVLPVAQRMPRISGAGNCWVFATCDPLRPEVHQFLETLKQDRFELVYAPESKLVALFTLLFAPEDEEPAWDDPTPFQARLPDDPPASPRSEQPAGALTFGEYLEWLLERAVGAAGASLVVQDDGRGWTQVVVPVDDGGSSDDDGVRVRHDPFVRYVQDTLLEARPVASDAARTVLIQRWLEDGLHHFEIQLSASPDASPGRTGAVLHIRAVDVAA
ncbi:hypothetical protein AWN76_004495 [Rhodothermaceae bacterium RA]|nr:hypothetical protein AWN76_004495 [Rhodothermaceae bacterium RA]